RPRTLLDDDRRHVELLEARTEADPTLAAADDDRVRLLGGAELRLVSLLALEPALTVFERAVLDALRTGRAASLLVAVQFHHRRQQCPAQIAPQPDVAVAARGSGLEVEPPLCHAIGLVGLARD